MSGRTPPTVRPTSSDAANSEAYIVKAARAELEASVVPLPFYTKGTARTPLM